jgi:hypothetical protein
MKPIIPVLAALSLALATPVAAEFAKVTSEVEFKTLVSGKILSRPLVRLQVDPSGAISGKGAAWDVTGSWTWQNGYFCRSLEWGGDDLGYNCQEVTASAGKIRFTSDQGSGDSADFNLR